jgi:hypothetical protein
MAATGVATAAVGSAARGAYDNAYIPAVYFSALLSAACAVELPALARERWPGSPRILSLAGLVLLSGHAALRWLDPAPHVPTRQDHAEARRLLASLTEQGPEVFVPCHPYYSVLAGGRGHLHAMGLNDLYAWPRTITSDPARDAAIKDRFRESVLGSFRSRRWKRVIEDDCATPRLFGLDRYYRVVEDLARSGRSPRSLTGYPCAPRQVWAPRGEGGDPGADGAARGSAPSARRSLMRYP